MLTKEQIENIADTAPRYGLPSIRRDEVDELCRLALLGLEAEQRRLKPETVRKVRALFRMEANHFSQDADGWDASEAALDDIDRAYPEEV